MGCARARGLGWWVGEERHLAGPIAGSHRTCDGHAFLLLWPLMSARPGPVQPAPLPPADAHKPYAWLSYLGIFAVHWMAYLAVMGLYRWVGGWVGGWVGRWVGGRACGWVVGWVGGQREGRGDAGALWVAWAENHMGCFPSSCICPLRALA